MSLDKITLPTYSCTVCGKSFSRSDTLLRHGKSHHATDDRGPVHRVISGTFRACRSCALARSRCSGGTPCGRCTTRRLTCEYPRRGRTETTENQTSSSAGSNAPTLSQAPQDHFGELVFVHGNDTAQFSQEQKRPRTSTHYAPILDQTACSSTEKPSNIVLNPMDDTVAQNSVSDFQSAQTSLHSNHLGQPNHLHTTNSGVALLSDSYPVDYSTHFLDYGCPSFGESMNWIPPSIYPSPYDAELEQDFSFILPPFSDTAISVQDYEFGLAPESNHGLFGATGSVSQGVGHDHLSTDPLQGSQTSPTSSTSDAGREASSSTAVSTSNQKRKKRKSSLMPDVLSKPRSTKTNYCFPTLQDPSLFSNPSRIPCDYCSPASHSKIASMFHSLCVTSTRALAPFTSPYFPGLAEFNCFLDLYFEHFHPNFPLIHRPTFREQSHWLTIVAVAAIGSVFYTSQDAPDLGEAFQEFLLRAIQQHHDESPPDTVLDVPLAQARILNLVGLVQSGREHLRTLAPRYHAELSRWCLESGILQINRSDDQLLDTPISENSGVAQLRMHQWIDAETIRRIGYFTWILDCSLGYMANSRPLFNMDDARAPMPCADDVWEASTLDAWVEAMKDMIPTTSLCAAIETLYNKKNVDSCQSNFSQLLLIHALYQRTWEVGTHIKQPLSEWVPTGKSRGFLNTPTKDNFWLPLYPLYANWRNSACDCLDVLHWQANSLVARASGVEHTVVLHLHLARMVLLTPFQEIQDLLFSLIGKVGKSTRASFYVHDGSYQPRNDAKLPQIRKITWRWLREDQHKARLAMVHAGSVFWYIRRYSTMSFYEPFALYLAALVLWTYGSYQSTAMERPLASSHKEDGESSGQERSGAVQPSRMERMERPIHFINQSTTQPEDASALDTVPWRRPTADKSADANRQPSISMGPSSLDSDDASSSSDGRPEFIHLDRPCDDEIVQHFVRNGHNMSGYMTNVGDICKSPQKVVMEGAKLLSTKLSHWGVSREYYEILTKLAELRKAG
ncbi:hypothetical protein PV10_08976 [Exophiala mesophila]|uniref:C2H2-type domain-containing protein n=1 Tax=Exophiala mesophila TaxID=212818 RepID=A0A0D1XIR9_EXOME|nr:uncharacterized protein PV10_08976 [Exophiala mesophila]KIV88046.1 hypothetical protein PV10_08976 [Exophiala mesophila]